MSGAGARIGVVGGGILGMTVALRMAQRGHRVTLFEAADSTGGLAAPQEIGSFTWDRFYHVVLPADEVLLELLDELGLRDRVAWEKTRTGFYTDGVHYSLSSNWEFLRFPPLRLVDKVRLGLTILRASRIHDATGLESVPVDEWLKRWSGERTFERMWLPLLRAKLGENHSLASAAFIWSYIHRLYKARQTGMKREVLGYLEGGYAPVLERFRDRLVELGVTIRTGAPVEGVHADTAGAQVRLAGGAAVDLDAVVLTVASSLIPRICPQLSAEEQERLNRVVYQGVVCASVLLKKPLRGFYVTNITDEWVPFTAVIEMTALVPRSFFGGYTLVYLPRYLPQQADYWARTDEEIEAEFVDALLRMYDELDEDDVVTFRVSRARNVQALATLNYQAEALPRTPTSLPRVFVANSSQIVNGTLNLNETITVANTKSAEILRHLERATAGAST